MAAVELDELDRAALCLLQQDGRLTNRNLAKDRTAGPADYLVKIGADRVADIECFLEQLRSVDVECHALRQAVILRNVKAVGRRTLTR